MKYKLKSEGSSGYLAALIAIVIVATGCASNLMMEMRVDRYLPAEDYSGALADLKENQKRFGERNRLLFLLNRGAVNFYSGHYDLSASDFLKAARLSDELFTRSISTEAAGLVNPNITPYDGEDYEKVMIHVFAAFSFIKMGKLEEAGVEARAINQKLELLSQKYDGENKYSNDAFAQYLTGIIYEALGEPNNAYVSYKLALDGYRNYGKMFPCVVPDQLKLDILRLARYLGFRNQYQKYSGQFELMEEEEEDTGRYGEAVLIAMTGLAPFKRELEVSFTHVDDEGKTHTFQILVPELVRRQSNIEKVYMRVPSNSRIGILQAEEVQDITEIAFKNMSDRMPGIMVRAWLRALAKFKATESAKEKMDTGNKLGNLIIGTITDAVAEEVTRADIRCWRTLPGRIHLKRIRLKPGVYDLVFEMRGSGHPLERIVKKNVEIKNRRTSFLFAESFK